MAEQNKIKRLAGCTCAHYKLIGRDKLWPRTIKRSQGQTQQEDSGYKTKQEVNTGHWPQAKIRSAFSLWQMQPLCILILWLRHCPPQKITHGDVTASESDWRASPTPPPDQSHWWRRTPGPATADTQTSRTVFSNIIEKGYLEKHTLRKSPGNLTIKNCRTSRNTQGSL